VSIYTVTVKPGSSKGPLVEAGATPEELTVFLHAKAVDGAANKQLVQVLSKHFHTAKSNITIIRGQKSRVKHIEVFV
jgi:uncharacterized protein (TIGR00251 family)